MTSPSPAPLTDAEKAAAEVLDAAEFDSELTLINEGSREAVARAVVAAVRPLIEADALDALADAAVEYGPATADHIRLVSFTVRKGRSSVRDWLASDTALSLPASKETPDAR